MGINQRGSRWVEREWRWKSNYSRRIKGINITIGGGGRGDCLNFQPVDRVSLAPVTVPFALFPRSLLFFFFFPRQPDRENNEITGEKRIKPDRSLDHRATRIGSIISILSNQGECDFQFREPRIRGSVRGTWEGKKLPLLWLTVIFSILEKRGEKKEKKNAPSLRSKLHSLVPSFFERDELENVGWSFPIVYTKNIFFLFRSIKKKGELVSLRNVRKLEKKITKISA